MADRPLRQAQAGKCLAGCRAFHRSGKFLPWFVDVSAAAGFVGQLLASLFFLLLLLRQIPLTFFELVVGFGQEVSFARRGERNAVKRNSTLVSARQTHARA